MGKTRKHSFECFVCKKKIPVGQIRASGTTKWGKWYLCASCNNARLRGEPRQIVKRSPLKSETVLRDGKEFHVTKLPDAAPPKGRSQKTRYHHKDVGKPGTKT